MATFACRDIRTGHVNVEMSSACLELPHHDLDRTLGLMQLGRFIAPPGLFRLSLAFVVFVSHCTRLELGSAAVYLFFMLSGFWVRQMWSKEYAPTTAPYRTFIISRLWRLLPVHYIALLMLIPLQYFLWGGILPMAGWPEIHFALSHVFLLGYATLAGALQ